ncbi:type IV toxin-antitoxin system AbiEi family antitoxin domain-containing protein [Lichenifustis flavocetrariae]|uniref:Transcriptional regulator n=1 Tax=Lichenifustis flavocetrariae TaxID=2949735 RepID=A0AA42CL07_9HYPH|nr:hypothetical protein [Lichenifustis flavocetrariae]MCW6509856.1 hypothetical protein [Lichenifustis flavocetrariae]
MRDEQSRLDAVLADDNLHTVREIVRAGVPRGALAQAAKEERAIEVIDGVWISMAGLSEHFEWLSYGAACLLHPSAIICMYSACLFHDISDELPWQLWLAVDPKLTRRTRGPTLRSVGWSGPLMTVGIETHMIGGARMRITDKARTTADVLRLRKVYGDEPAMKALHDYVRHGEDIGLLWDRAVAIGALKAVEPFVRAADEFKRSIPISRPIRS